jgi:SAM-dependent methyltransferase
VLTIGPLQISLARRGADPGAVSSPATPRPIVVPPTGNSTTDISPAGAPPAVVAGTSRPADPASPEARAVQAQRRLESYHEGFPDRTERIGQHIQRMLEASEVSGRRILEIGGRLNPHTDRFSGFECLQLDLEETGPGVIRGDITACPEIPSGSFDAVISVDVFEHIREPWLAASEIVRLLRPGGFTYHSTLFSWRYHPCPVDYWRFTPAALSFLFGDLRLMRADFDTVERRRNLIGRGQHRVAPDAFGGWRENWRVFYAGVKPE